MTSPTLRDALEALEPFAKIATRYAVAEAADGKHWPDPHWVYVELGDCRKAAEALRANSSDVSVPRVVDDIASERKRQVEQEGWSVEHDDADHGDGELSMAAMAYVQSAVMTIKAPTYTAKKPPKCWPWSSEWWKPKGPRRDLIRAGALIVAEIERIDRAAMLSASPQAKGEGE